MNDCSESNSSEIDKDVEKNLDDAINPKQEITQSINQSIFGEAIAQPTTSSVSFFSQTTSINPIVHNVVATANFCCKLDLFSIVVRVRNAEYNPNRFRAVIMRIFEPRTTAMIFASGKIVITGAKSERLACLACKKYAKIIGKVGYEVKFSEFKIQNMVSTVDMKFPIRLDKLSVVHSQFCTYDPDFFPALIYRMVRPRTVLLIFVSGKIIITAKSRAEIFETIDHIGPVLNSFRKC
ncbi:TATA-box-binding protein [Sarcoptes scabiei]|nr:TATA-box-binding protein [Sarcoptes scabiei]